MELVPDPIPLRERLRKALKVALNARDDIAAAAIRSAMSAVDNAGALDASHAPEPTVGTIGAVRLGVGAAELPRRELSPQDVIEIIRREVSDRMAAATEYERLGRAKEASTLKAEAKALTSFLETV